MCWQYDALGTLSLPSPTPLPSLSDSFTRSPSLSLSLSLPFFLAQPRSTGFLQGFSFTVALAQECKWKDVGGLEPIREFFQVLIENMLRLHGPAAPLREYSLDAAASRSMAQLYDFYEDAKLDASFAREVRDYMAKHSQWNGSFAFLAKAERNAVEYSQWLAVDGRESFHRVADPRGAADDPPTTCICQKPVAKKKCKRVGKKGNKLNLGREFYVCPDAGEKEAGDDWCEFFQWADEPRNVGAMPVDIKDLVDENFPRDDSIQAEDVVRGGMVWAEAIYYMQGIGNEIRAYKKKVTKTKTEATPRTAPTGDMPDVQGTPAGETRLSGKAMDKMEIYLSKVLRQMGPVPTLTLSAIRDKKGAMGKDAVTSKELKLEEWVQMITLAEHLGFGSVKHVRSSKKEDEGLQEEPQFAEAAAPQAPSSSAAGASSGDGDKGNHVEGNGDQTQERDLPDGKDDEAEDKAEESQGTGRRTRVAGRLM